MMRCAAMPECVVRTSRSENSCATCRTYVLGIMAFRIGNADIVEVSIRR